MSQLTEQDISLLRGSGKIAATETVILEGDIVVAIDQATGTRRVVSTGDILLECKRKLLCD